MEEQGLGSKQILDSISEVNEITRKVTSGSNEMLEGARTATALIFWSGKSPNSKLSKSRLY